MFEEWNYPIDICCSGNGFINCPIKLDEVYCDGYLKGKKIGAITHFHSDHISTIPLCLQEYDTIITHEITHRAFRHNGLAHYEQWYPMGYGEKYVTLSSTIRLLEANHIPGSAQIHVETDGKALLYSGDFNYPSVTIREADYLVLDATHGDPSVDGKTDRKSVLSRMYEDVKEKIDNKKSVVIYTDAGTLQEIIRHFEIGYDGDKPKLSHDIPFVAKKEQIEILHLIYEYEKKEFRELIEYCGRDFWKHFRKNKPCVIFLIDKIDIEDLSNMYRIWTGRYQFRSNKPAIEIHHSTNSAHYNLASHASIDDVLKYVEDVKAKVIVLDGSRSSQAKSLARQIELHSKLKDVRVFIRGNKI